jgi:hypothetical protein
MDGWVVSQMWRKGGSERVRESERARERERNGSGEGDAE